MAFFQSVDRHVDILVQNEAEGIDGVEIPAVRPAEVVVLPAAKHNFLGIGELRIEGIGPAADRIPVGVGERLVRTGAVEGAAARQDRSVDMLRQHEDGGH